MTPEMRNELAQISKSSVHWDVAMADYCTFRTGGTVEALVTVPTREELGVLMQWLHKNNINWRVIGRGSNVLVRSSGFKGVVIILGSGFSTIETVSFPADEQEVGIRVGAGCPVGRLVNWCCENGVSGTEFLVGIPGSVGGAVRMNAGAWGSEIGECIESVALVDNQGNLVDLPAGKLDFSYRHMEIQGKPRCAIGDMVIIETVLRLERDREKNIIARCREYQESRRKKQPLNFASAGSFFKNPPGDSAGRLIDEAGLKGLRKGNAMVSTKHANFIVNTGQATPDDIVELMEEVQEKVFLHSGIRLEPEVQLL